MEDGRQIYGWSAAAAVHLYATLGNGEKAVEQLRSHHNNKRFVMPNTQYIEGSPVYECSLVAASSLQYMLLQSWGGTIRVFPAVPQRMEDGGLSPPASGRRVPGQRDPQATARRAGCGLKALRASRARLSRISPAPFQCDHPDKLKDLGGGVYELAIKKGEVGGALPGRARAGGATVRSGRPEAECVGLEIAHLPINVHPAGIRLGGISQKDDGDLADNGQVGCDSWA